MIDPVERFTVLYDRHYRNVLGYVLLRAEQGAAEDVVSETFLVAWRRLDDLPDPVLPWLLGVARNLLHKQYDSGRRRQVLAERIIAATTLGDLAGPDVAENVVEREAARAVLSARRSRPRSAPMPRTPTGAGVARTSHVSPPRPVPPAAATVASRPYATGDRCCSSPVPPRSRSAWGRWRTRSVAGRRDRPGGRRPRCGTRRSSRS